MRSLFLRLFPTPSFLRLKTVGLDFSDATLRMIELVETRQGIVPVRTIEFPIPKGAIEGGRIVDRAQLVTLLTQVKKEYHLGYVRVSISEPQIYFFAASFDLAAVEDLGNAIELVIEDYIPLKASETVFDFVVVATTDHDIVVQVTAMSAGTAELLCGALEEAGMIPLSFELEGQAIARAIIPKDIQSSSMIVDFGAHRTSIAIITAGTVVFTSTIAFGGMQVTEGIARALNISVEEAERRKREVGFTSIAEDHVLFEALTPLIAELKDEIDRRLLYWHEKRPFKEFFSPIEKVYLVGGDSNLAGLDEYLRATLRISVALGNPWQHCLSFDKVIPSIPKALAMSYTTAIGLALVDMPRSLTHAND